MLRRIRSCQNFSEGNCPYQKAMEGAHLMPQLTDAKELQEYQRFCLSCLQCEHVRREIQRIPVSFLVDCQQDDLTRMGGRAFNLSTGGVAIKTNYPFRIGEQVATEFVMPETNNSIKAVGEVVWRQFHGDTDGEQEALFTAGIKFLQINELDQTLISRYVVCSSTLEVA